MTKRTPILTTATCLAILLHGVLVLAQAPKLPQFGDYPERTRFRGKPAPVNLKSHRDARMFRTMLREGAKLGPNFAGHFTVATWHCGIWCISVAVIEAKTGRVFFAPFTVSEVGADYRIDSRLFVANPPERNDQPLGTPMLDEYEPRWYVWKETHFERIPVKIVHTNPDECVPIDPKDVPRDALPVSEIDLRNAATQRVDAQYPKMAAAAGITGSVIVQIVVDQDGNVTIAHVYSGHPLLRAAALDAVRNWKFRPADHDGARVPVVGFLTFRFVLNSVPPRRL